MNITNFQYGFREIPHKSDVAILVCGSSLPNMFIHATNGMYHIMGIVSEESPTEKGLISLQAPDNEGLLVSYLSELLYLTELNIMAIPDEIQMGEYWLISKITKKPLRQKSREIKAVTFSELMIIQNKNYFQTKIVFDL